MASACGRSTPSALPLIRAQEETTTSTSTSTTTTTIALPATTAAPSTTVTAPRPATTLTTRAPAPVRPPTTQAPLVPTNPLPNPQPITTGMTPYRGLGTWVDVYDWSRSYTNNKPTVGTADVDRMAAVGVQTLYLQASFYDFAEDVVDRDRLLEIISRAHAKGIQVVGWYLPTFEDLNNDLRRLLAVAKLPVDGIAVDIESRKVADVAERNRRLVSLSASLRQYLPDRTLGAIVLPPVLLEVINTNFWPSFPWSGIKPYYDLWLPMSYFTNRTESSGYRDAYRYSEESIRRLRNNLEQPTAIVHTIGGIGDKTTTTDVDGMLRAAADRAAIGGSIYDWRTTGSDLWPRMAGFRVG